MYTHLPPSSTHSVWVWCLNSRVLGENWRSCLCWNMRDAGYLQSDVSDQDRCSCQRRVRANQTDSSFLLPCPFLCDSRRRSELDLGWLCSPQIIWWRKSLTASSVLAAPRGSQLITKTSYHSLLILWVLLRQRLTVSVAQAGLKLPSCLISHVLGLWAWNTSNGNLKMNS